MSIGAIASQAFVPNKFAGLRFWLDMADIGTITDLSGDVSGQVDKSRNGFDVLQTVPAERPRTGDNTINGLNVFTFDGVDDDLINLNFSALDQADGYTIFIVAKPVDLGADALLELFVPVLGPGISIEKDSDYRFLHRFPYGVGGDNLINVGTVTLDPQILTYLRDKAGNNQEIFKNALSIGSIAVATDAFDSATKRLNLGGLDSGLPFNGDIGEVIIYDRALLDPEREEVNNYLFNKWTPIVLLPFLPPDLVGLQLWLDAADLNTITQSANLVSQWDDKSGNDAHVTQPGTDSLRPLTNIESINGLNTISFDGVDDVLAGVFSSFSSSDDQTIILVFQSDTLLGIRNPVFIGGTSVPKTGFGFLFPQSNTRFTAYVFGGREARILPNDLNPNIGVGTLDVSTGDVDLFINGSIATTFITTPSPTTLTNNITLGRTGGAPGFFPYDGKIAEVIIYNRILLDFERRQVDDYLSEKWGINLVFPRVCTPAFTSAFV